MGNRTNHSNPSAEYRERRAPDLGRFLDWRVLVGLVSIVSGVFVGSRTVVTQQDLRAAEALAAAGRAEIVRDSTQDHAAIAARIERIWEELSHREAQAFRQKDAALLKELLQQEIRSHGHER